jgi:periplasmic divalent cation tolerance protein
MSIASIYVIFGDADEAERIGRAMVEQRLAACINILGPVRSIYRWGGRVEDVSETAAIFKTSAERAEALIAGVAALHSYEVPCVVAVPVDAVLPAYAGWVDASVGAEPA